MKLQDLIKYSTELAEVGRACLTGKCKNFFIKSQQTIQNTMDMRPCRVPFEIFEIVDFGNVIPCCFTKYKNFAGNLEEQSADEIWNGYLYTDLRERMLKGDFSMCNRDICCMYKPLFPEESESENYLKGPNDIKLTYDSECNYNCITCRDVVKRNTTEELILYDEVYLPKIIEIAKNAEIVTLSLWGDPLYSRHMKNVIKALVQNYPNIKFRIHTNGLLLNKNNIESLGIINNIQSVDVSVNSIKKETYKKILRTDGFETVMKNLEIMSELKQQGKIEWITMNFVVHLMNYKEMPEFAKLAQKLDALAFFTTYRPWTSAEYHKRYDEVAVFEPTNKHYKELVKILHNPIFKDSEHCYLEPRLADIANS